MAEILHDAAVVFVSLLLAALVLIVPCGGWLLRCSRFQSRPTEENRNA